MKRFFGRILLAAAGFGLAVATGSAAMAATPEEALAVGGGGDRGAAPFTNCASRACIARAVGDLDGDGMDDLVMESVSATGLSNMDRSAVGLEVTLAAVSGPSSGPTAFIPLVGRGDLGVRPVARLGVAVGDLNADGFDDLVWAWASNTTWGEVQRVTIIWGRTTAEWAALSGMDVYEDATVIERRVPRLSRKAPGLARDLNIRVGDVNGDGHMDLVLAADPSTVRTSSAARRRGGRDAGEVSGPGPSAPSEIAVMYGNGRWHSVSRFRDDVTITGLGACHSGFGAIGDLTGDGVDDLVVRRCAGAGLPDTPVVLVGGALEPTIDLQVRADRSFARPGDPARPIPELPEPPRGYFPSQPIGDHPLRPADALWVQDMNHDGVGDLLFEFGGKTHVWSGGADIVERVEALRTDGVIVDAGFGMTALTGAWRLADLDGVAGEDMILAHGQTRVIAGDPRSRGPVVVIEVPPLLVFSSGRPESQVLDLSVERGDARWHDSTNELWAIGDFDGDGHDDLLIGPSLHSPFTDGSIDGSMAFRVLNGPLASSTD